MAMQSASVDAPRPGPCEGAHPTAGQLSVSWTGGLTPLPENNPVGLSEDTIVEMAYQCNGATDDGCQGLVQGFDWAGSLQTSDTVEPPLPPSGWNRVVPRNTGDPYYDYRQVQASQIRDENYSSQGKEGDVGTIYQAYSNYQTPHAYSHDQISHAFSDYQASYEYSDYMASYSYSDCQASQGYSNYPPSNAYSNYQASHAYANYPASDRLHDNYAHGNTVWVSQSSEQQGHEGQDYSLHQCHAGQDYSLHQCHEGQDYSLHQGHEGQGYSGHQGHEGQGYSGHQGHEGQDYSLHHGHEGQDYSGQQGYEGQGHTDRGHVNHQFSHQNYFASPDEVPMDYTMKSLSGLDQCNPYSEVRAYGLEPGGNEGHLEVRSDKEVRPNPISRDAHFSEQNSAPVDLHGNSVFQYSSFRNPQRSGGSWYAPQEPHSAVPVLGTTLASTAVPSTVIDAGQTSCVAATSDMNTARQSFSNQGGQGAILTAPWVNGPGFNVPDSNYQILNPQNTGVAGWMSVLPVAHQLLQPQGHQTVVNTGGHCQNLCWILPGHTQVIGQGTVSNRPILPKVASVELVDPNSCSREEDNFLRGLQQQMVGGQGSGVQSGYEFKLFKFRIGGATAAIPAAAAKSSAVAVPSAPRQRRRRRRRTRSEEDPDARTKRLRDAIKRHWRLVQMDKAGLLERPACLYCGSYEHADVTRTDGFKVVCGKMKCPRCDRYFKMVYCLRKHYCGTHAPPSGDGKSRVVIMTSPTQGESNPGSVVTLSSTFEEEEEEDVDDDVNDLQEGLDLSRSGTLGPTDEPKQQPP